ncbi:MAG TPA: hypothetical protein VIV60_09450 [Polyangiaceae bacterium]
MRVKNSIGSAIIVLSWLVACGKDDAAESASSSGGGRQAFGTGGSAQSAGASNGGTISHPATGERAGNAAVMLSELTAGEAIALCQRLASRLNHVDYDHLLAGHCAIVGLTAAMDKGLNCETVAKDCVAAAKAPPGITETCVPEDFPTCTTVSEDEYVQCRVAMTRAGADYYGYFTCNSGVGALGAEMQTPTECEEPFMRCSAFAKASTDL